MHRTRFRSVLLICSGLAFLGGCSDGAPKKEAPRTSPSASYGYGGFTETPAAPELPDDITQWQAQDFLNAKTQGSPALAEAVRTYGKRHAGDESVVPLLVQLVSREESSTEEEQAGGPTPASGYGPYGGNPYGGGGAGGYSGGEYGYGGGNEEIGPAIIEALAVNNTDAARTVLVSVLAGRLNTIMEDGAAVSAVLTQLASNRSDANRAILFNVATAPQTFRAPDAAPQEEAPGAGPPPGIPGYGYGAGGYGAAGTGATVVLAGGSVTATSLQQSALEALDAVADASMRTRMAEAALGKRAGGGLLASAASLVSRLGRYTPFGPTISSMPIPGQAGQMSAESRQALVEFLIRPRPDNLEAQLLIYQDHGTDEAIKSQLDGIFLAQSSSALQTLMGLPVGTSLEADTPATGYGADYRYGPAPGYPPRPAPGASTPYEAYGPVGRPLERVAAPGAQEGDPFQRPAETAMTRQQAERVAALLWGGPFAKAVARRIPLKGTEQPSPDTMLLAGTMVSPSIRQAIADVSYVRQEEAPRLFRDNGLFQQSMADPGLLPILKPYAQMPPRRPRRGESPRFGQAASTDFRGSAGGPDTASDADPYEDLLNALITRLSAAPAPTAAFRASLPFELPETAEIITGVAVDWSQGKVGGADIAATKVWFTRVRQNVEEYKIKGFFRRKAGKAKIHESDNRTWIDGLERNASTGTVRSVDVVIARDGSGSETFAGPAGPVDREQGVRRRRSTPEPEWFTVDILVIEIPEVKSTLEVPGSTS